MQNPMILYYRLRYQILGENQVKYWCYDNMLYLHWVFHIRSYCVRSPWYWLSVTRLVFHLYCVNFVIYWKYCVSDILRLHMTFMTLGSFCLVVKMKIFTVIHILTQRTWKKVYIFVSLCTLQIAKLIRWQAT